VFSHKLFFILFTLGLYVAGPECYANPALSVTNISSKNIEHAIAPFQKISEKELIQQLIDNTRGTQFGKVLTTCPLVTVFLVRFIQDKQALPYLAKILENKARLIQYTYWMIGSLFLGFIVRRVIKNNNTESVKSIWLETLFIFMLRISLMLVVRVAITYYFFASELTPTVKLISKTFF
jgi:hypothetical protein